MRVSKRGIADANVNSALLSALALVQLCALYRFDRLHGRPSSARQRGLGATRWVHQVGAENPQTLRAPRGDLGQDEWRRVVLGPIDTLKAGPVTCLVSRPCVETIWPTLSTTLRLGRWR